MLLLIDLKPSVNTDNEFKYFCIYETCITGGGNSTTTTSVSQDNNGRQRGTSASSSESRIAAVGIDNPNRKNKTDHKLSDPSKSDSGRRESIEGKLF